MAEINTGLRDRMAGDGGARTPALDERQVAATLRALIYVAKADGHIEDREPENAWGQQRGNCQSGSGTRAPEAVVSIPGAADGEVELSVESDAFAPTLYARTVCDSRRR